MIAVIFEAWPKAEHKEHYLELAAEIRPLLESIEGFVSVERFESLTTEGKLLSLSFFDNEKAVMAWRETLEHKKAQSIGRNQYFANYHLRVCSVMRDYGPEQRAQAPQA
ncbi:MAG: antibiotic biosynthesis monooxygenase family protein [Granulosicoccaceae bacterium]